MNRPPLALVPTCALAVMVASKFLGWWVAETNAVSILLSAGTSASVGHLTLAGVFVVFRLLAILVAGPALLAWLAMWVWRRVRARGARA